MDITKYLTDEKIKSLQDKGVSENDIVSKIETYTNDYSGLDYDEKTMFSAIKNRLNSTFAKLLSSNLVAYDGIVLGIKKAREENNFFREWVNKNLGVKRSDGYVVKEGLIPWGNAQGEPIPEGEDWRQQITVGVDNEGTLVAKEIAMQGDWVNNKEINDIVVGDVIQFQSGEKFFEWKGGGNIFKYNKKDGLTEDTWAALLSTGLKPFVKTIKDVTSSDHKGFTIMKVHISDMERTRNGYSFMLTDDSFGEDNNFDINNNIVSGSMKDVNFVEGARDLIVMGDIFENDSGKSIYISKAIVPDVFKKVELTEETSKVIEDSIDEDLNEKVAEVETTTEGEDLL